MIEKFFWNSFCDNYLELIKDQLFHPENYDHEELFATRWTLHTVGLRILQLFAPYMPFVTESIYELIFKECTQIPSLHLTTFNEIQVPYNFAKQAKTMEIILHILAQVRKLKTAQQLSLKTELQALTIYVQDKQILTILKNQEKLVKGATKAGEFFYKNTPLDQAELKKVGDFWHAHVIGDLT